MSLWIATHRGGLLPFPNNTRNPGRDAVHGVSVASLLLDLSFVGNTRHVTAERQVKSNDALLILGCIPNKSFCAEPKMR